MFLFFGNVLWVVVQFVVYYQVVFDIGFDDYIDYCFKVVFGIIGGFGEGEVVCVVCEVNWLGKVDFQIGLEGVFVELG